MKENEKIEELTKLVEKLIELMIKSLLVEINNYDN